MVRVDVESTKQHLVKTIRNKSHGKERSQSHQIKPRSTPCKRQGPQGKTQAHQIVVIACWITLKTDRRSFVDVRLMPLECLQGHGKQSCDVLAERSRLAKSKPTNLALNCKHRGRPHGQFYPRSKICRGDEDHIFV